MRERRAATVEGDEKLRLFLAFTLPEEVVARIVAWGADNLAVSHPPVRRLQELHVTIAFLGSTPRTELEGIVRGLHEMCAEAHPFTFAPRRYRETRSVGMLVLDDPTGEATRLAGVLQERLERLGVYRREKRPWLPHVTVLRFREQPRLSPALPALDAFAPSGAAAFLSRLHPSGARYEILELCQLNTSAR